MLWRAPVLLLALATAATITCCCHGAAEATTRRGRGENGASPVVLNAWQLAAARRTTPPARAGAVLLALRTGNSIILHGGISESVAAFDSDRLEPLGDLWLYSLRDDNWRQIRTDGSIGPRAFHAATQLHAISGHAYMFGGQTSAGAIIPEGDQQQQPQPQPLPVEFSDSVIRVQDVSVGNVRLDELKRPNNNDPWPEARVQATFDLVGANTGTAACGVLFGGISQQGTILGDAWLFHPDNLSWAKVPTPPELKPRYAHVTAVVRRQLILSSGCTSFNDTSCIETGDVWTLAIHNNDCTDATWTRIAQLPLGMPPRRFGGVNSLVVGDDVLVFEGAHGSTSGSATTRTFHRISLEFDEATSQYTDVSWTIDGVDLASSAPADRDGFSIVGMGNSPPISAVMFGGLAPLSFVSDTWRFSSLGPFWTRSQSDALLPLSVILPGYATIGSDGYLFGGQTVEGIRNRGLWHYDLRTDAWQLRASSSQSRVAGTCLCALTDNHLAMFAGADNMYVL